MDSDFCEDVDENYIRKVFTTYINSAVEAKGETYRPVSYTHLMKELFTESGVMKNEKDKKNIKRNYPFIMVYALLL